ncbi:hypothetical protein [Neisseria sp. GT4A_CT1]|uniref:hypothetical protein n=1 Tax=Neisseria sp. GT4A_CT1 TaxID=665946 RepID=UPI0018DB66F3|nr:hypothetical protein [Neisseria sp. GT4A_CT1]
MLRLAACHLSHPAGEGWGEGGSMGGCTSLILPKAGKPPPSSPDGGRNKVADTARGRLKWAGGQESMPRRAACPLSRLAGEGWGEGGSMGCTNLIFPSSHKATPILAFPRQTGEGTGLLINQRGRLKIRILDFR